MKPIKARKVKHNPSLVDSMRELYVDKEGNTISDAVDLGLLFLKFADGVSLCKEIALKSGLESAYAIDFFFLSLIVEASDLESYRHNEVRLHAELEKWKYKSNDLGLQMQDVVFSSFLPILNNAVFTDPAAGIALRFSWLESVDRMGNAHAFSEKDPMIAFANFQCSYHPIALISFLCSQDIETYKKMSMRVESFVYQSATKILGE